MSLFPTGVTVAAVDDGREAYALTVASFASVSLEPPLVLICVRAASGFLPVLRRAGAFAVHVLAAEQSETARFFAERPAAERAARLDRAPGAAPRIDGALARFAITLEAEHGAGDHAVLVGRVEAIEAPAKETAGAPLLWWRSRLIESNL